MCGISGIVGESCSAERLNAMVEILRHRGPDDEGTWVSPGGKAGLGHDRLSIIDLSEAGHQPMPDAGGRYWIVFNGEVYNYLELRRELVGYPFKSQTDTEVVLAAYIKWGAACLDRFIGMFAFAIWDEQSQTLFAARDRLGVKPFYYHLGQNGELTFASEIKALFASGVPAEPDAVTWASYLGRGLTDYSERTFWKGIQALRGGNALTWRDGQLSIRRWYDLAERVRDFDERPEGVIEQEYEALMTDSVRLRFRSDVPVGINLSGGLDSSVLLGLVHEVKGAENDIKAFTFITGDPAYDELVWARRMLARTRHPSVKCLVTAAEVPDLAQSIQAAQDEPYSGLPTLAYARLFEVAREQGIIVLLDGNGMDEQWAGYDYYAESSHSDQNGSFQASKSLPFRADCLVREFGALAETFESPHPFDDRLRNLQYRDAIFTKIPRAIRFNDRISMRVGCELRDPFLDHRLFELALRQPADRKIREGTHKWMLRKIAKRLAPDRVVGAFKRPLQTPQREWLGGPLKDWATGQIETAITRLNGTWLDGAAVRSAWQKFCAGEHENSFYVWQWISLAMMEIGK